jgi:hypothetical protein
MTRKLRRLADRAGSAALPIMIIAIGAAGAATFGGPAPAVGDAGSHLLGVAPSLPALPAAGLTGGLLLLVLGLAPGRRRPPR